MYEDDWDSQLRRADDDIDDTESWVDRNRVWLIVVARMFLFQFVISNLQLF